MIDSFKMFESRIDIDAICVWYSIKNYTINDDMTVSVIGDVNLSDTDLIPLKFKKVSGNFDCSINKLESLEGCPEIVGGDFYCYNNTLESLEFCPKEVGGSFYCHTNHLKSLEFCPKEVGGGFYCSNNRLKSLEFCPEKVGGYFNCSNNYLESLEFCPKEINTLQCINNQITSFDGLPEFFESHIEIAYNPVFEIYELFYDPKCIYYIKEFDVIRGNKIIKDRLDEVYVHMGLKMPKDLSLKEYILI